ncbi:MAG: hypothetical protein PUP92_37320 [Rhizonema sp. PD38]|nr:hypothetical protein [Rhizonema sp. PD38]
MNIDNLDKSLISFELSDEDVQAIRGGSTADNSVASTSRIFPIVITVVLPPHKKPWVIIIKTPPPIELA